MTDRRVLLAAMLSALFLAWYSNAFLKVTPPRTPSITQPAQPSGPAGQTPALSNIPAEDALYPLKDEQVISIESKAIKLDIGHESAAVRAVTLKEFLDGSKRSPLHISGNLPLFSAQIDGKRPRFSVISATHDQIVFSSVDEKKKTRVLSYSMLNDNHAVRVSFGIKDARTAYGLPPTVIFVGTWVKTDQASNMLEVFASIHKGMEKYAYKKYGAQVKHVKNVPRGTSMISLSERYFCEAIKLSSGDREIQIIPAAENVAAVSIASPHADEVQADVYFGPRDYFYLRGNGFERAIPIGVIGQIGLILLLILSWIGQVTNNYGVAVILFSILITILMSPLTIINFRSMKKLQEIKPHVDRIMAKHKGDQMKANQEVFALYKENRINPLSGCLPMLLQMPILIALFQAMSHFIQLRGKSFLWIQDLSLPDKAVHIPFSIPVIGSSINILPIVMAAAMYIQTKMSQPAQQDDSNPAAKMMSGPLMPVIFCLMFYNFPAGLVLYWLTNSLMSMAIYKVVK